MVCSYFLFRINLLPFSFIQKESDIPTSKHDSEVKRGLEIGLQGASSINDKTIPTFSRGELPHFAGINTFMKAPFVEDVRNVGGKSWLFSNFHLCHIHFTLRSLFLISYVY
jgi:hypothetical protein